MHKASFNTCFDSIMQHSFEFTILFIFGIEHRCDHRGEIFTELHDSSGHFSVALAHLHILFNEAAD